MMKITTIKVVGPVIVLALMLFAVASLVLAQDNVLDFSDAQVLNQKVNASGPRLATDGKGADGVWIAVWDDIKEISCPPNVPGWCGAPRYSAYNFSILVSRSTDNGKTWSDPIRLREPTTNKDIPVMRRPGQPRLVYAGEDRWILAWLEILQLDVWQFQLYESTNKGVSWTDIGRIQPKLADDNQFKGDFELVYDKEEKALQLMYAASGGLSLITPAEPYVEEDIGLQLQAAGLPEGFVSLEQDGSGSWTYFGKANWAGPNVTWLGLGGTGTVVRSKDYGQTWSAVSSLPTPGGGFRVAADNQGNFLAIWQSSGAVLASYSEDAGETWTAPVTIAPSSSNDPNRPIQVIFGAGQWIVTWQAPNGSIQVSYSKDKGATWSTIPIAYGSEADLSGDPRLATDDYGHRVAIWKTSGGAIASDIVDWTAPETDGVEVNSNAGPVAVDDTSIGFTWSDFPERESAIEAYEVALGDDNNAEAYHPFSSVAQTTSVSFCSTASSALCDIKVSIPESADKYVFSVRAVNIVGLKSPPVTTTVTIDPTAYRIGQLIPFPDPATDTWEDIDWTKTIIKPSTHVIKIEHAQKLLVGDWGKVITIHWQYKNGASVTRQYKTASEPVQEAMTIYYTHDGSGQTSAPPVDLQRVPTVTIHYNEAVPNNRHLWLENGWLYARSKLKEPAYVVLEYNNFTSDEKKKYEGIEVVRLKPHNMPDVPDGAVHVGSRLLAANPVSGTQAYVTRNGNDSSGPYIYQHNVRDSKQAGQAWAVRPNSDPFNMEVIWRRPGLKGILWPYEMRRYKATWPDNDPAKYQLYVRSEVAEARGPQVSIPASLHPEMVFEELETGHASLEKDVFSTDGPGWTLLRYQTGPVPGQDWVGFEVVRSVLNTDKRFFDLNPAPWDIGTQITDTYHAGNQPGYIHDPERDDRYDPTSYDTALGEKDQIFAVNEGTLEVWWYNLSRIEDPEGPAWPVWPPERVQWPSKVVRYQAVWPADTEKIIIARQNGSGVISKTIYGTDWSIYVQNDKTLPGFNPNDEHALKAEYQRDQAIFALRDDLGTDETSQPYVLMKYKEQPANNKWRFRVFQVVREEAPYYLKDWVDVSSDPYEGTAGLPINAPYPLSNDLQFPYYCPETEGISGPYFEDRTAHHWAKAAGNDGGPADITMRYYYPVQDGFFFPDKSPQPGECVPWLDNRSGTPADVVYTISWPDNVPEMKVGETLIGGMHGLPDIAGRASVDIIYQQSVENGGGASVALIDPVQTRKVTLAKVPDDIATESSGDERIFTDLTLALRLRISYGNNELKFKGILVKPPSGSTYALLNVMSERERDELLALSNDAGWVDAVNKLYDLAKNAVEISSKDRFDKLALSSGFAQGTGYVTLAMENGKDLKDPVSLKVIKVIPELDPGKLLVLTPPCPFDETLTMRHQGDFGGHTENFQFEWRYLPDEGEDEEPTKLPKEWLVFPPKPANGVGAIDITIKGPGLLTLSDNWIVGRYKYTGEDLPWSGRWSEWTKAQLAPGWIKRIMGDINPFEQRARGGGIEGAENRMFSYHDKEVNTVVSMISQAGEPWAGNVPMNCQNLDDYGLLQIYETVFNRGKMLSIDGAPPVDYPQANQALLLVAGRIADLYTLLGNEAYADAADPTIAFGTEDGNQYAAEAASIHSFENMTGSLLEEELALLRGRDDAKSPGVHVHPVYNRLFWNFTNDLTGGEVAYALNYNIYDRDGDHKIDGRITEADAKALYPQGHGDAWGHYLTAIKAYYQLLRHPRYTWDPRSEKIPVGGREVLVDYLDERKFAAAAAAKARTGAEIVNLTYRYHYVEDPKGQWQGYKDKEPERAWGLAEWASRSGQGAYLDWVVGNAILPAEDSEHTDIQKIDRTTVLELREVANRFDEIQSQLDTADSGLNPLGLATNVVPFDISPDEFDHGKTHFEQIYDRAVTAMNNAITVFNHANNSTQLLRRQADIQEDFKRAIEDREVDFKNRLIEIFGYPYADDIGADKTYPTGYDGPDLYHYAYVEPTELTGVETPQVVEIPLIVKESNVLPDGSLQASEKEVVFHFSASAGRFGLVKPKEWTHERGAPGEIQMAQSDLIQMRARFERALVEYNNLLARIEDQAELLQMQYNLNTQEINILNNALHRQETLDSLMARSRSSQLDFQTRARMAVLVANATAEALPLVCGTACDVTSVARSAIQLAGAAVAEGFSQNANRESLVELSQQQAAQAVQNQTNIELTALRQEQAIQQLLQQLQQDVRQEHTLRFELYTLQEAMLQSSGRYMAVLARGQRLLEEQQRFRSQTASQVQVRRYKDMAFRIFRNDALQKYRAQFDLAARYVYLAAKAYDYETTLLSNDPGAGEHFLTDIVRARLIGTIQGGLPQTGTGLADPMAQMSQNFSVIKGKLGFNNPQRETKRFSLRHELFRIGRTDDKLWREKLWSYVVPNLLDLPEYQRYAQPILGFAGPQPGIVIPFGTSVTTRLNFFGLTFGSKDHHYNPGNFTTKIRTVGVWFSNYNAIGLGADPLVYLIPVGSDIQRSPTDFSGHIREFKILDQALPVPFEIGKSDLNHPNWIPIVNNFKGPDPFAAVRRYSSFRAYHDSGEFSKEEVARDSRLIGRSVWNTKWLLIIPASDLLGDQEEALKRFIGSESTNEGIQDILIFFETYAYPGN